MKKGPIREWFDALLWAVIAASLIRWATFEAFTIPTPSMEKTLLVGDFLFVNKLNYGPRTPLTPLQVPLTHQKIWGTDIPSYLDWIKLPTFRLPGFGEIERNDVVVFNYPNELDKPIDLKTYYVKRCVGLPGDTLSIDNGSLIINAENISVPEGLQKRYFIQTDKTINERVFRRYDIWEFTKVTGGYYINTKKENAEAIGNESFVRDITLYKMDKSLTSERIFPDKENYPWNTDYYGPLLVPYKGLEIDINNALDSNQIDELIVSSKSKNVLSFSKKLEKEKKVKSHLRLLREESNDSKNIPITNFMNSAAQLYFENKNRFIK